MRNIQKILLIIFSTTLWVSSVYAEDYKIGAVNTIRILEQAPQSIAADKTIKEEFSARDRELLAAQKKIKSMEERLAKDSAIMSEEELKKIERDIINSRRDLKRDRDEFREDINFRFNEVRSRIQKEVFDAIVKVAKAEKYDVVFFDGVAYASSRVDMSDLIIKYLKEQQPAE